MKSKFYSISLLALIGLLFCGCDRWLQHSESSNSNFFKIFDSSAILSVQDINGIPIAGAQVMIGEALNVPFTNNLFVTDSLGNINIPANWMTATSLSVSANGFITASFLHSPPIAGVFKLRKQNLLKKVEYSGVTKGYPPFDDYSVAHISLVFEALKRSELADFSIANIISPDSDSFSVFGNQITVPSNLSIPDQILSYIFPFRLAKPGFRLPLQTESDHLMVGLHAQFAVTDLVRSVRDKAAIFAMINFFSFTSLSQQSQHIDSLNVNRDIDISSIPLSFKNHLKVQTFDPSLVILALSVIEQNGLLVPLDVKSLSSGGSIDLNSLSQNHSSEKNIRVLRSRNVSMGDAGVLQEVMSIAIHDANISTLGDQLGILKAPTLSANVIAQVLPAPSQSAIVNAGLFYSFCGVTTKSSAGVIVEIKTPLWDVYNPNWEEKAALPVLPSEMTGSILSDSSSSSHRWTVSLLGQDSPDLNALGPDRLKSVNYITRAAVDIK